MCGSPLGCGGHAVVVKYFSFDNVLSLESKRRTSMGLHEDRETCLLHFRVMYDETKLSSSL